MKTVYKIPAALGEPQLCYILDAILFLYGIVLTLLYCRLKIQVRKADIASREVWSLPHLHTNVSFQALNLPRALAWGLMPQGSLVS
ncbi:high affinity immunoglobulin epsilon receptor subunit gamma isoform X2 [Rattus norvegicus]|uniref:high affinity immunoglobulin epsilon receptor subunit gamma isoform X2 n=1 Tax=Rattus norvegicus TaxID=10116 RepID=UPI002FD7A028